MFKWHVVNIRKPILFLALFLLQIVVAEVEEPALQFIAKHLLPNECERIVSEPFYKVSSNGIDCFQKLVGWTSNPRVNKSDIKLLLGNRLREIGRNDLANWLVVQSPRERDVTKETIEFNSWNEEKDGNRKSISSPEPTISEINRLMYGPPAMKSIAGLPPRFHQQSISSFPELRKLNGMDTFQDRYLVMAEPDSAHPATLAPAAGHSTVTQGPSSNVNTSKENNTKDGKSSQTTDGNGQEDKSKLMKIIPQFTDEKNSPCLRVPLTTALVVIGTIMILTCCIALLLRNRLAACFERLRGKKKTDNKTSKRLSIDEEQGFMGPRTFSKTPKRSGRKGGGTPTDMTNVGVQKSNHPSNGSGESEEKPTGCCTCCTKKKKKNRKKWKK